MDEGLQLISETVGAGVAWYGVASGVVVFVIRLLRHPVVQAMLPGRAQWAGMPLIGRLGLVFLLASATSLATGLVAGHTWQMIVAGAVSAGMAAVAGHKVTKTVGHAMTRRSLGRSLAHEPGSIRTSLSPLLPIDHRAIRRAKDLLASADRTKS